MQADGNFYSSADINKSGLKFTPENVAGVDDAGTGSPIPATMRFVYGLAAIKNVGETAHGDGDSRARRTRRVFFVGRFLQPARFARSQSQNVWKASIKAGGFDFTRRDRAELFACIEDLRLRPRGSPARPGGRTGFALR